jgi:hypothetical protein
MMRSKDRLEMTVWRPAAPTTRTQMRWIAAAILGSFVLASVIVFGWHAYQERRASALIRPDEVELSGVVYNTNDTVQKVRVQGYVTNRSKHAVTGVTILFSVRDRDAVIDSAETSVAVAIPPGEIRRFSEQPLELRWSTVERLFPRYDKLSKRVRAIVTEPEFKAAPPDVKRRVLRASDPDFAAASEQTQDEVIASLDADLRLDKFVTRVRSDG